MRENQVHEAAVPRRHRAPGTAALPPRDAEVLRLQRLAGNAAVSGLLDHGPAQRVLDEGFGHGAKPSLKELAACRAFARKVSDFVDEAHAQLMAGDVAAWQGPKITTFLDLLQRKSPMAVTWAGNAIEERVYALMRGTDMTLNWVPQFAEGMGSASKPDIVITLNQDPLRQALVDITSDRGHILGKAGGWTTSAHYVYVAEAWFPSVQAQHLATIRAGVEAGGLDAEEVERRIQEADEERARVTEALKARYAAARIEFGKYESFSKLVKAKFKGDRTAALAWMRGNGLGQTKGVPRLKGKKKPSEETKAAMKRRAAKARELKKAEILAGSRSQDEESSMHAASVTDVDLMDEDAGLEIEDELEAEDLETI
jgi:hypothetical protein